MADPEDATIFVGEIRAYFTFAGVYGDYSRANIHVFMYIHLYINVSVYV